METDQDRESIRQLWRAASIDHPDEALALLEKGYERYISKHHFLMGSSPFHMACIGPDSRSATLKAFLKYPDINVNVKTWQKMFTGFAYACENNRVEQAKLLLADPRVDLHTTNRDGLSPRDLLMTNEHDTTPILKHWMISGRPLRDPDMGQYITHLPFNRTLRDDACALLAAYARNPWKTTCKARLDVGGPDFVAAYVFAMIIFLCDGLLGVKPLEPQQPIARFWNMAKKLPIDLQIVLARRAAGSGKDSIVSSDKETAFQFLTAQLLEEEERK